MDPVVSQARFATCDQIDAFVARFSAARLPGTEWNHDAHLVVGLWHALHHPPDEALDLLRHRIRAHNESVGTANTDSSGYHETLTRLYLLGLLAWLEEVEVPANRDPAKLVRDLLGSDLADRQWPLRFYSSALLAQPLGRRAWVDADRHPVPVPRHPPAAKGVDGTPRRAP